MRSLIHSSTYCHIGATTVALEGHSGAAAVILTNEKREAYPKSPCSLRHAIKPPETFLLKYIGGSAIWSAIVGLIAIHASRTTPFKMCSNG